MSPFTEDVLLMLFVDGFAHRSLHVGHSSTCDACISVATLSSRGSPQGSRDKDTTERNLEFRVFVWHYTAKAACGHERNWLLPPLPHFCPRTRCKAAQEHPAVAQRMIAAQFLTCTTRCHSSSLTLSKLMRAFPDSTGIKHLRSVERTIRGQHQVIHGLPHEAEDLATDHDRGDCQHEGQDGSFMKSSC